MEEQNGQPSPGQAGENRTLGGPIDRYDWSTLADLIRPLGSDVCVEPSFSGSDGFSPGLSFSWSQSTTFRDSWKVSADGLLLDYQTSTSGSAHDPFHLTSVNGDCTYQVRGSITGSGASVVAQLQATFEIHLSYHVAGEDVQSQSGTPVQISLSSTYNVAQDPDFRFIATSISDEVHDQSSPMASSGPIPIDYSAFEQLAQDVRGACLRTIQQIGGPIAEVLNGVPAGLGEGRG